MRLEEGSLKIGGVDITPLVNEYLDLKEAGCPRADDVLQQSADLDDAAEKKIILAHEQMAQAYQNESGSMLPDPQRMSAAHKLLAEAATLRSKATKLHRDSHELRVEEHEKMTTARIALFEKFRAIVMDYLASAGVHLGGPFGGPQVGGTSGPPH